MQTVTVGTIPIGDGHPLVLIAGPCVLEDLDATLRLAEGLRAAAEVAGVPLVFKASFDKANRTSRHSYRGPGLDTGLAWLARVRSESGLPVTTDIHLPSQAAAAAEVVDLLQIPAFLSRQTDLIAAAGATGLPVNLKKGQFLAPEAMAYQADKAQGAAGVLLTERGTSFGYGDLVVDMRAIPRMRALGHPVCFDATHSTQRPGALGDATGGEPALAPLLAAAAVAMGADAVFAEVHADPPRARSDAASQLPLTALPALLTRLVAASDVAGRPT